MNEMKVFVVEDDHWYREYIKHIFNLLEIDNVELFSSGKELIPRLKEHPDLITLDFNLPDIKGDELLKQIQSVSPNTEAVIVSGQENIQIALEFIKKGAFDYLIKDEDIKNRMVSMIQQVQRQIQMKSRITELESLVSMSNSSKRKIISADKSMDRVHELIEKASQSIINISIYGESGTGKELVAKAIHEDSTNKKSPFVAVNLSAIPESLMESELFGHKKGSFTGAIADRKGKFEEAGSGTIFLDEIGEISPNIQVKLLRVLQEREITPIGGNGTVKINCRIITATNKDLKEEVLKGNFREDLYYRLIGMPIHIPPLRERGKDSLLLANSFIREFCALNKLDKLKLTEEAANKILRYNYPGNVRELRSVVELATIMASNGEISAEDIVFQPIAPMKNLVNTNMTLKEINEQIIDDLLSKNNNNVRKVAKILDIGKSTIYRMLKERVS